MVFLFVKCTSSDRHFNFLVVPSSFFLIRIIDVDFVLPLPLPLTLLHLLMSSWLGLILHQFNLLFVAVVVFEDVVGILSIIIHIITMTSKPPARIGPIITITTICASSAVYGAVY